jgi:CHASE2 domain-containing sensor protein
VAAPDQFLRDPQSGRPLAPLWWSLFNWVGIAAGLLSALSFLLAYEAARHGESVVAAGAVASGLVMLIAVYLEAGRIRRKRVGFDERVAAYERALRDQLG